MMGVELKIPRVEKLLDITASGVGGIAGWRNLRKEVEDRFGSLEDGGLVKRRKELELDFREIEERARNIAKSTELIFD